METDLGSMRHAARAIAGSEGDQTTRGGRTPSAAITEATERRGAFLEMAEFLVLRAVVASFGRLSQERSLAVASATGTIFGAISRVLETRSHRRAMLNLEIAFPEASLADRDAIRRAMWGSWGRMLAEVARLPRIDARELRDLVRLDPPHGAADIFLRARRGGAIVLTAHFGSFELLHAACAAHGFPITLVHRTLPNRRADCWLTELRERCGSQVLRRGAAAREILRALRDGRVVALPFDQRPVGAASTFSSFFSLPVATSSAIARLAISSGAPVFPVVIVREGTSARHRAVFGSAIAISRTGDRDADVVESTRRCNASLEGLIRDHPEHWSWMYSRWKRLPGNLGSPYRRGAPPLSEYRRVAAAEASIPRSSADGSATPEESA
jgi:Kdo2-lipid IVA lauroyltransferase/acyltransferase